MGFSIPPFDGHGAVLCHPFVMQRLRPAYAQMTDTLEPLRHVVLVDESHLLEVMRAITFSMRPAFFADVVFRMRGGFADALVSNETGMGWPP